MLTAVSTPHLSLWVTQNKPRLEQACNVRLSSLITQQMNSLRSTLPNPYSQKVPGFNLPKVTNEGYGEFQGKRDVYTYANLGMEKEYIPSPNDDPKTEYRIFTGCSVFFAKTKKQLFEGDFEAQELPKATVVIYY